MMNPILKYFIKFSYITFKFENASEFEIIYCKQCNNLEFVTKQDRLVLIDYSIEKQQIECDWKDKKYINNQDLEDFIKQYE